MVSFGQREGVDVRMWNGHRDDIPVADIVIIQGSLCHFMPHVEPLIERLRRRAREYVIVSEPIRSHVISPNRFYAMVSRLLTTPVNDDGMYCGTRYTLETFTELASGLKGFKRFYRVPGDRDLVAVLSGREDREPRLPQESSVHSAARDVQDFVFES
jgi:hypothetical protein